MESSARDNYLAGAVLTATPEKLHLMLIEGAIRFAQRARQCWKDGEDDRAFDGLIRAQDIVGHLTARLNYEDGAKLVREVAAIYGFILRSLADANLHHDDKKLGDALRILELERQTWQQVCQRAEIEKTAETPAPRTPHFPPFSAGTDRLSDFSSSGLSLEA